MSRLDMAIGYTHGRYQPLHNGHFQVFLQILDKYDEIWIGITNPECKVPKNIDSLDPELRESVLKARAPENNPFTFEERKKMIIKSLEYEGVDILRVKVSPPD